MAKRINRENNRQGTLTKILDLEKGETAEIIYYDNGRQITKKIKCLSVKGFSLSGLVGEK